MNPSNRRTMIASSLAALGALLGLSLGCASQPRVSPGALPAGAGGCCCCCCCGDPNCTPGCCPECPPDCQTSACCAKAEWAHDRAAAPGSDRAGRRGARTP